MKVSADLNTELGRIEHQISSLQDYLYETELYPQQPGTWARLRRTIHLFLTRRYIFRQIQQLHLQRQIVRNRYSCTHEWNP